jgi:tetratricopeptide (TPR) repeat protein
MVGTVCALVIGFYAASARLGQYELRVSRAEDSYYNLLVRGFRAGQLNLKTEAPPGLTKLADPYDPLTRGEDLEADGHPLNDLSYYHGKLYLYFGVVPALVLFWPYAALTGHYLWHKDAVVVFCAAGFLASVGLLCAVWRRCFPGIGLAVVAAGALALGLAGFTPMILARAEVFEVAISCGYALTMMALVALWEACERPERRGRWLAAASLAYGLAVGARLNLLFGAMILLVPVVQAWREGRRVWAPLLAATGPITCIGLGLMLYNALRFDNPFEFGMQYQLLPERRATTPPWNPHYLGFNFWVYFLAPARWSARFPFVHDIKLPPWPAGYWDADHPFGILANIPLVWLTVALPLAWRGRPADARWLLRGFVAAVALLFATIAFNLGFRPGACVRYELDFCPALVLLAVVGILGLERALADRPAWRRAARWVWGLLLAFSLAFNLLASAIYQAQYHWEFGRSLLQRGQVNEALAHHQKARVLQGADAAAHFNLGDVPGQNGQTNEAVSQLHARLRLLQDYAEDYFNLGIDFDKRGQETEAIRCYQVAILYYQLAVRLKPDQADAHNHLGIVLARKGQTDEAIEQFREALRLQPDNADARRNLEAVLAAKARSSPPPGATNP